MIGSSYDPLPAATAVYESLQASMRSGAGELIAAR